MTNQLPLFPDADPDPDYQDEYRELLQASWNESLAIIIDRYGIPPWCEQDNLLNADELRVMTLIDESGEGWIEGGHTIVADGDTVRRVSPITVAAGFTAEANCNAVINGCLAKGYIKRVSYASDESRLMIAEQGRWRLDCALEGE